MGMSWRDYLSSRGLSSRGLSSRGLSSREFTLDDVREHAGVGEPSTSPICVDLGEHTLLRLVGADARAFLQGYVTCDVGALKAEQALVGAFCNLKGRVLADGVLLDVDAMPAFWLHGSLREHLVEALQRYLAFSKSKFVRPDETWVGLGLVGALDGMPTPLFAAAPFRDGIAVRMPGATPRWLTLLSVANAIALWEEYESRGGIADASRWDLEDIRARWARVTAATSEAFLPQMLGLTAIGAVSFTKGCYLGQEIVARAEHRGSVKRHLMAARWTGPRRPSAGEEIVDRSGRAVGTVVLAAIESAQQGEALVVALEAPTQCATRLGDVTFVLG
jgi:folate-binding protein YgfZ